MTLKNGRFEPDTACRWTLTDRLAFGIGSNCEISLGRRNFQIHARLTWEQSKVSNFLQYRNDLLFPLPFIEVTLLRSSVLLALVGCSAASYEF